LKLVRQMKILEIIKSDRIETQQQLAQRLAEAGEPATQATVSRDIKDLRLVKVPSGDGRYFYALPPEPERKTEGMAHYVRDTVLSIDYTDSIIVIKCLPGTAAGVGAILDRLDWQDILGSVAGDDTIIAITRKAAVTPAVVERLRATWQLR